MRKPTDHRQQNAMPMPFGSSMLKEEMGTLKGKTVQKDSGKRLFGVVVELVGTGRAYVTSPTGYFKLRNVSEGVHVVRFTYPGFEPVEESVFVLEGETLDLTVEFE